MILGSLVLWLVFVVLNRHRQFHLWSTNEQCKIKVLHQDRLDLPKKSDSRFSMLSIGELLEDCVCLRSCSGLKFVAKGIVYVR